MAERTGPVARWQDRGDDGRDGRDGWNDRDDDRRDGRDGGARWEDRRDGRDQYGSDARFDRPNRGDRFAGDARVGHHAGMRMVPLPDQYRSEFRDSEDVYYRFDNGRIYRINRATNMILGLFDI